MNVLIIGSGGREHAIASMVKKSNILTNLFIAPGNAGTSEIGTNVDIRVADFNAIAKFSVENKIDLIIVGPEDPIVNGIYDFFKNDYSLKNIAVLSPSSNAAMLEGSKHFAKLFMKKYNIPTAAYKVFNGKQYLEAKNYLEKSKLPVVLKVDGLAAGKGVTVAFTFNQAISALDDAFLNNKFGDAGQTLVVEEFLDGIELSAFVLTDGKNYILLPEAKDYKQVGEENKGPNTGGMGSVSPVPFFDEIFKQKVLKRIIEPTISGLQKENMDYKGFIFFGLMNMKGDPYVIEYNVRLGDPETESILPRIENDMLPKIYDAAKGCLKADNLVISPYHSATVMLVSGGYPGNYEKGKTILVTEKLKGCNVFVAGAIWQNNMMLTNGGRVLAINALGKTMDEALKSVYSNIKHIGFDKMYFRRDIGKDLSTY